MAYANEIKRLVENGIPAALPRIPTGIAGPGWTLTDQQVLDWFKGNYPTANASLVAIENFIGYIEYVNWIGTAGRATKLQEELWKSAASYAPYPTTPGTGEVWDGPPNKPGRPETLGAALLLAWATDAGFWTSPPKDGSGDVTDLMAGFDALKTILNRTVPDTLGAADRNALIATGDVNVWVADGLRVKNDAKMLKEIAIARGL